MWCHTFQNHFVKQPNSRFPSIKLINTSQETSPQFASSFPVASLVAHLVKNMSAMWETWVWSLGLGRSPGEGIGYPLQYSGLENSMGCILHGFVNNGTQLSGFHSLFFKVWKNQVNLFLWVLFKNKQTKWLSAL